MDPYYKSIGTFLCYHLLFLDRAYAVFRIEYNDLCSRYICKSRKCCFSGISGCCCEDHDLILHLIFLCGCGQKMRQNGQCHILKSNRLSVEQFQIISLIFFYKRSNLLCIEFLIVCFCDAVFQFLFRKIGKKLTHNFICSLLVAHPCKGVHICFQCRKTLRYKQTAIICQSFQDCLGCSYFDIVASGTFV